MPPPTPDSFLFRHPYRTDVRSDGTYTRFGSLVCAADSAAFHRCGVYDEMTGRRYSFEDCRELADGAWRGAQGALCR
jgi:hypothetical protein